MNVEIGAEAALIPEMEYINGIAVAVQGQLAIHRQSKLKGQPAILAPAQLQG
jgi:hypothetical protein